MAKRTAKKASRTEKKPVKARRLAGRGSRVEAEVQPLAKDVEPPEPTIVGEDFPIVGVGASAGGLEAATALVRKVPADTGMAFVLVQHLHPQHHSMLAELLGKSSRMPFVEAQDGMRVEPNHFYIIPPDAALTISERVLRITPREAGPAQHMTIDQFLRSLATDLGSRAIGIVLSGSSSDGALGIEAIKGEGGITFAQDDKSARYDVMPRAAVATGCVDFVLSPEAMAEELVRIARHPYVRQPEPAGIEPQPQVTAPPNPLRRVLNFLRGRTGVDFSQYKHSTIQRRIARRMALHHLETLADYVQFIDQRPAEIDALYSELLINVTGFFRDPDTFEFLKTDVVPRIVNSTSPETPIRIWVPGCATGEEAYSIAIVFLEYLRERNVGHQLQIFATDISDEAIAKARAGTYIQNIEGDVSRERLRRFFVKHDGQYQVSKTVRDLCIFARQNVAKDPPFSKLDLISCRNVLIYLDAALQKRILPTFHYALNPGGFLMLGNSETITASTELFQPLDRKHRIYAKRPVARTERFELEHSAEVGRARAEVGPPGEKPGAPSEVQKEADRVVLSRFAPAGVVVNEDFEIVQFRGKITPFLEPASGKASLNLLKMLREGLLLHMRTALLRAKRTGRTAAKKNVPVKQDQGTREVDFEVIPLHPLQQGRFFVVTFQESMPAAPAPGRLKKKELESRQVAQLKRELTSTREYLQSLIEDREATNEELQSASEEVLSNNEELQSINEELETAKEELQSTNEELTTVNEELQNRNAELSQTNDDLGNLLSSIEVGILMLGSDLRIRRFTPAAGRILNLIPSDAGRPLTDLGPSIQVENLGNLITGVMESAEPLEREVMDRNGRWYTMAIRPYRTADNRIDGAVLSLVDVDAIKRSLGEARRARDLAQAIIDAVYEPLIVLDRDLRITGANPALERVFHVSPEEAQGRRIEELAGGMTGIVEMLRAAVAGSFDEREIELPGVGTFLARIRMVHPGEADGATLLVLHEITERKRAEEQVRLSEVLYRELFEQSFSSTTEGILLLDASSGEITGMNPYLAELLGVRAEQVAGRPVWDVPRLRAIADSRQKFRERSAGLRFDELVIEASEGRMVPVAIAASHYQAGSRHVVQLNFRDLSARRTLEEQLRQAHKMEAIGRLAGGVAHDFNNLLTVITGNAEILTEEIDAEDVLLEQAEEILKAANRAASLTRRLLTFSRHDVVKAHPLNLNSVVESMRGMLDRLVGERARIEWQLADGLATITADESQLEQVVLNLVINSREAMPSGGAITIRTANTVLDEEFTRNRIGLAPGPYVVLEVADTGVGMSEQVQQHVFEPFFTTKPVGQGTGLGLATVYAVAKQSGGDVMVESQPGQGTKMFVYFPVVKEAAEPTQIKTPASAESLRGSETVLVVEDDAGVRRLVAEILGDLGYTVLEAEDGPEALELARSKTVDLLLTDMVMPKMNGQDLAAKLKEAQPGARIMFISGYTPDEIDLPPAPELFLPKPFSREELARKVREVLESEG